MAKNEKYVLLGSKKYEDVVEVVKNKESDKDYINYTLKIDDLNINLSLRNYDSTVNSIVKSKVLAKQFMKKFIEKIKNWNNRVINNLKHKYHQKGWTYRKLVEDYFHLSILFFGGLIINLVLVISLIIVCL